MQFEEKFIAFIDVLGFKDMVESAENRTGRTLSELMESLSKLGTIEDEMRLTIYGSAICPQSTFNQQNLNFKITQISDCVIVTSEISPAGAISLINHCWVAVMGLLREGILCRGYITKGSIYHQNNQIVGTGYQKAYEKESGVCAFKMEADERGTPFVEIDPLVSQYIMTSTDECVQKMFSRMVKTEEETTALFPFKRLSHSFIISKFDPEKEKKSNDNIRKSLYSLKEKIMKYIQPSNEKAMRKVRHYIKAIDQQLQVCDETDKMIEKLLQPLNLRKL
ncbi:hypothetical protein [Sulfuricurvum sp.]|uniref:hypothetical protein n=1 Tax=Sulfuricurvum sp. TaxID=2025608 RepID=UPI003C512FF4